MDTSTAQGIVVHNWLVSGSSRCALHVHAGRLAVGRWLCKLPDQAACRQGLVETSWPGAGRVGTPFSLRMLSTVAGSRPISAPTAASDSPVRYSSIAADTSAGSVRVNRCGMPSASMRVITMCRVVWNFTRIWRSGTPATYAATTWARSSSECRSTARRILAGGRGRRR